MHLVDYYLVAESVGQVILPVAAGGSPKGPVVVAVVSREVGAEVPAGGSLMGRVK